MAAYAPAGGVLLSIGWIAALATHDGVLIVLTLLLMGAAFAAGVALRRAVVGEWQGL